MKLYRYTTNGEGIWSAGKRLLPEDLVEQVNENRKWLPKPPLADGSYRFYLTEKGKEKYEQTLYPLHQQYLSNIKLESIGREKAEEIGPVVYEDEWQVVIVKKLPKIIEEVGFGFHWDPQKVWALDVSITEMDIDKLTWHFDIPFHWHKGGFYNLTSREVLNNPEKYKEEYERTIKTDLKYPIDIMENKGRWLILDGLHRLMKAYIQGQKKVKVRIVPREMISQITK